MSLSTISRIGLFSITVVVAACGGGSEESAPPQPQQAPPAATETSAATGAGRITGFVFEDKNRNATFDGSDTRTPKLTVVLTNSSATQQVQSTTTGDDGSFRLENLAIGEYRISLQIPEGYERTNDDSFKIVVSADAMPPEVQFGIVRR